MNKVKEKLKKYFSENDIDKLLEKLESKQRSFLINDNYFVKIGKNSNKFFFDNLIKEIKMDIKLDVNALNIKFGKGDLSCLKYFDWTKVGSTDLKEMF